MEEINDCLGLGEKTTDYILTEGLLDALPTLYQQDEEIYQYNQGTQKWSEKSCTLFSPIGAVSDLFNLQIPLETIKVRDNGSYDHWRMKDSWWWVSLWVDYITDCYNNSDFAKKYGKVAYYSIDLKNDELVKKILDKRYTICTGFQGNSAYSSDKNKDGVLDGTEWWRSTYGHAVSVIWWIKTPSRIKDNYYGTSKYNIYGVAHEFSEIPTFYDRGYVLTKVAEDNLEELKRLNEMNTVNELLMENNSKMWHLTNNLKLKDKLHEMNEQLRKTKIDIENEIKKKM